MGFFNPIIPNKIFVQSRNPDGFVILLHPVHSFNLQSHSHIALIKSQIPHPKKPIGALKVSLISYKNNHIHWIT